MLGIALRSILLSKSFIMIVRKKKTTTSILHDQPSSPLIVHRLNGLVLLQRANVLNPAVDGLFTVSVHTFDRLTLFSVIY